MQALARPEVAVQKFVPAQEMEFTAEVDIVPKIKLGDYKKLSVKKEKGTIGAKDINEILERMQSGMATKTEVARAAKNGDVVTIDFVGKKDGEAFEGGAGNDYDLELGSNSFIPGFEEGIVGLKAGESKDLKLTFPDNYQVDTLAGADVVFETTIKKVQEKSLPALDDEFAKSASPGQDVKDLKSLKADIERELKQQKEREADEKHKDALVQALVDKSDAEAPEALVQDQQRSIEQDMTQNLMYQGMDMDAYLKAQGFADKDEWIKKEVEPTATKRVQAGLVLAELSKELKVTTTKDEREAHINSYKERYMNNPDMLKRFDEPEVQRDLANRLLTEKTVDKLVELNT